MTKLVVKAKLGGDERARAVLVDYFQDRAAAHWASSAAFNPETGTIRAVFTGERKELAERFQGLIQSDKDFAEVVLEEAQPGLGNKAVERQERFDAVMA